MVLRLCATALGPVSRQPYWPPARPLPPHSDGCNRGWTQCSETIRAGHHLFSTDLPRVRVCLLGWVDMTTQSATSWQHRTLLYEACSLLDRLPLFEQLNHWRSRWQLSN